MLVSLFLRVHWARRRAQRVHILVVRPNKHRRPVRRDNAGELCTSLPVAYFHFSDPSAALSAYTL